MFNQLSGTLPSHCRRLRYGGFTHTTTFLQEAAMNKHHFSNLATAASAAAVLLMPVSALAQTYGGMTPVYPSPNQYSNQYPSQMPSASAYVPAGMMLEAQLQTAISTEAAKPGDLVSAVMNQPIQLGNGVLPSGTVLEGTVETAKSGGFLGRAGRLTIKFNRLRTPNGLSVPMAATISGDLGKYHQTGDNSNSFAGEAMGTKVGQAALRTAIGAGAGAALGTAVGAIAGRGRTNVSYQPQYVPLSHGYVMQAGYAPRNGSGAARGAGRGAWSGAAIGGGVGLADSLILRKGKNVNVPSGTPIKLQLDAPLQLDTRSQYGAT